MKMKSNFDKVVEFSRAMGVSVFPDSPAKDEDINLASGLIVEELQEFAQEEPNTAQELKELCDLLYVVYSYGARIGYDMNTAFNLVHASNMSKLGDDGKPIYREDGKVLKGPNYTPPDLTNCLPTHTQIVNN